MDKKEILKSYLQQYGELSALQDIASILQDLAQEWQHHGDKAIGYAFSDAANSIAEAANKLKIAESHYVAQQDLDAVISTDQDKMRLEFNDLMRYFETLSVKELRKTYNKNKNELMSKLKRLEFLKRQLDKHNDNDQK